MFLVLALIAVTIALGGGRIARVWGITFLVWVVIVSGIIINKQCYDRSTPIEGFTEICQILP